MKKDFATPIDCEENILSAIEREGLEDLENHLCGEAIRKCRTGEPMSDKELLAGIRVLTKIVPQLGAMGDFYHLTCTDLRLKLTQLEGFKKMRPYLNYSTI